tara:strand:- start:64 stop:318 length:255 start_codon:yes stop_codon:yes gene_type:complete
MANSLYNGWTNHSTWDAVSRLFNDEAHYVLMHDTFREETPVAQNVEHFCRGIFSEKTFAVENLHKVNWHEVAATIAGELNELKE